MGENSKIEWTDHTFNAWIGCQEVSAACDHCYARVQNEFRGWVKGWGPHGERRRTSVGNWTKPVAWNKTAARLGVRYRVFCSSLSDIGDNQAKQEWRDDLKTLIRATPNLDWLMLTKRPENLIPLYGLEFFESCKNIWAGTTAENMEQHERRGFHLKQIPARVHFFSVEPMLGGLDLFNSSYVGDWYICGGESGPGRRPMQLKWARDLKEECLGAGIPFFMKQIDKVQPIPDDLMTRQFPEAA